MISPGDGKSGGSSRGIALRFSTRPRSNGAAVALGEHPEKRSRAPPAADTASLPSPLQGLEQVPEEGSFSSAARRVATSIR